MKKALLVLAAVGIIAAVMSGCGESSAKQSKTGFLSDYSRLSKVSEGSLRYMNEPSLKTYSAFIVDEVKVNFFEGAAAIEKKSDGKVTQQELRDLTSYFHTAIVKAIEGSGRKVVYQPGPGVARIRVALTDIAETRAINVMPTASLLKAGVGGAAMEAEIVDSRTGRQIGAVVESRKGGRVPFTNLGNWGTAKGVMDQWAKRLRERLE